MGLALAARERDDRVYKAYCSVRLAFVYFRFYSDMIMSHDPGCRPTLLVKARVSTCISYGIWHNGSELYYVQPNMIEVQAPCKSVLEDFAALSDTHA